MNVWPSPVTLTLALRQGKTEARRDYESGGRLRAQARLLLPR